MNTHQRTLSVLLVLFTWSVSINLCYAQRIDHEPLEKVDDRILRLKNDYDNIQTNISTSLLSRGQAIDAETGVDLTQADAFVDVFIEYKGSVDDLKRLGCKNIVKAGSVVAADIPLARLEEIALLESVQVMGLPSKVKVRSISSKPSGYLTDVSGDLVNANWARSTFGYEGEGVIIGIIDTGIDFSHPAFLDEQGNTRVLYLWDQKGEGSPPRGFDFGTQYNQATLNANLNNANFDSKDLNGHGTHVAAIAAGNGNSSTGSTDFVGVAPKADIIAVSYRGGRNPIVTGYDGEATDIIRGIEYIAGKAVELDKPWVVSLSLGPVDGSHNNDSYLERAINHITDDLTKGRGRLVVSAVGNDGYDLAASAGLGNLDRANDRRRLHYHGDGNKRLDLEVINANIPDIRDRFGIDIFHRDDEFIKVTVRAPNGESMWAVSEGSPRRGYFRGPGGLGNIFAERLFPDRNASFGSRDRIMQVSLTDRMENDVVVDQLASGTWEIRIETRGDYHVYVRNYTELKDATGVIGGAFLAPNSYTNSHLIGEPSNATTVLSVGSMNSKNDWNNHLGWLVNNDDWPLGEVSYFSSPGPVRSINIDKPEIYAPGRWIASARSKHVALSSGLSATDKEYFYNYGTSMAAPHVAGAAALLMQKWIVDRQSDYNHRQIKRILTDERNMSPNGMLDVYAALGWEGVIVGIHDDIEMRYGDSTIALGSSFSYGAKFVSKYGDTYPTEWNWRLSLRHSTGTYQIASKRVLTTSDIQSWNTGILSASIDESLDWERDENGNILGTLTVSTIDNNGDPNIGGMDIALAYRPTDPTIYAHSKTGNSVTISYFANGATSYHVVYDIGLNGPFDGPPTSHRPFPISVGERTTYTLDPLDLAYYTWRVAIVGQNSTGSSDTSNVIIVQEHDPPAFMYDVEWTDLYNTTVENNRLTHTGSGSGFNSSSAASVNRIPPNTDGFLEFTIRDNFDGIVMGLSKENAFGGSEDHLTSIDHAVEISGGKAHILHDGVRKGVPQDYNIGDVVRIARHGPSIKYYINGIRRYSLGYPEQWPLVADMCFQSPGDYIEDVVMTAPPPPPTPPGPPDPAPPVYDVQWTDRVNTTVNGNTITNTSSIEGWNSAAASTNRIPANTDGYVKFRIQTSDRDRIIGLSRFNATGSGFVNHLESIDYGIRLNQGSQFMIYRNMNAVTGPASYKPGDTIKIERVGPEIKFYVDDILRHTAHCPYDWSLIIDMALYAPGDYLDKVVTTAAAPPTNPTIPTVYDVHWTNLTRVSVSGNRLTNTRTTPGWNSSATSKNLIGGDGSNEGYLEFTIQDNSKSRVIGLSAWNFGGGSDNHWEIIEYALYLSSDGSCSIFHSGVHQADAGTYNAGDVIKIHQVGPEIMYYIGGTLRYVSSFRDQHSLLIHAALNAPGDYLENVVTTAHPGIVSPQPPVVYDVRWTDLYNASVTGKKITNTNTSHGWSSSAASTNRIPAYTDGYLEFTVATDYTLVVGFSGENTFDGSPNNHWQTVEYALYLGSGPSAVYHSGVYQGDAGTYSVGDVIRIQRVLEEIRYYVNGALRYTSSCPYDQSLIVDMCFNFGGDYLENVVTTADPGIYDVEWTDLYNVSVAGKRITNTYTAHGWNSSAASTNRIPAHTDGFVEFTYANTYHVVIGFSRENTFDGSPNNHWQTVEYAIYLGGSTSSVYHSSVYQGDAGAIAAGDVVKIQRVGAEIRYYVGGTLRYTSNCPYDQSLIVDMCFSYPGDYLENVVTTVPPGAGSSAVAALAQETGDITAENTLREAMESFKVSPNPGTHMIRLSFESGMQTGGEIILYDPQFSKKLIAANWELNEGENTMQVDIRDLRPGFYFVELVLLGHRKTLRLLKM